MNQTCVWKDLAITTNISAQINAAEPVCGQVAIQVSWDEMLEDKPVLCIRWSLPLKDIQYEWYPCCGKDRSLRVDWQSPLKSRISASAPVFCFFNAAGQNRLTMALSDVLTEIDSSLGVHEEDGTLLCEVQVPLDATGLTHAYSITLYRDEEPVSFAEALRRVSRWWEMDCGLTPAAVPDAARLPLYSAWYSFHQATIASEIEAECARARKLGLKTIIVDDGWQTSDGNRGYAYCGDWQPTPDKIPDMRAHVANVHALGMKYMLWYSVPFVGRYSEHWHEFKDMLLSFNPDPHINAGTLDPRYPAVREYLINTYVNALREWDLDGFKLDFIDSMPHTGASPAPNAQMDYARVEDATVRLMTDIMNALKAIKPDILIEFRQNYIGPAMRTYGNMFRVGDCPNDAISNRVGIVDLRLISGDTAVHSDMLMWHVEDTVEAAARQILNVLFGVMQVSVKLDEISNEHMQMLAFWCDFMEQHRALLAASIEVESPEMLYPVVRSRMGDEEAIAVYGRHVVNLSDAGILYVFNATADDCLVLRNVHSRQWTADIYDCCGRQVAQVDGCDERLIEMKIPVSGFAVLR